MVFKLLSVTIVCLLLSGCASSSLSKHDRMMLKMMQRSWANDKSKSDSPFHGLVLKDTEDLVRDKVQNKDFKLYGLAVGHKASEDSAVTVGVQCDTLVETDVWYTGCFPPAAVLTRLISNHNVMMINHPEFPNRENCSINSKEIEQVEEYSRDEEKSFKESHRKSTLRWIEKRKKTKLFN